MATTARTARFKIHVGHTDTGRNRWRRFDTLADATRFAGEYFRIKGVVVSIVANDHKFVRRAS